GPPMKFHRLTPSLEAADLLATVGFYREVLGFRLVARHPKPDEGPMLWADVQRDGAELMLTQSHDPARLARLHADGAFDVVLYVAVDDVAALRAELAEKGVEVSPFEVTFYGMKEVYVRDPDGRAITFAQECRDEPETVHDS